MYICKREKEKFFWATQDERYRIRLWRCRVCISVHNFHSVSRLSMTCMYVFDVYVYVRGCVCIYAEGRGEGSCYGVATISRLPENISLFCKRALYKRRYSSKETYDSKEPTNHSHTIRRIRGIIRVCWCGRKRRRIVLQGGEDP